MSLRKFLPVPSMDQITFKVPDDWHLHLRDGTLLKFTTKCAVQQCQRALIMPNIRPPVTNTTQAMEYKARILESLPDGVPFEPMMAIYMTDQTTPDVILEAKLSGLICGFKLYPAGATTNSESGVTNIENMANVFETMEETGMPLLLHGEVTNTEVDVFDREAVFIDTVLKPLISRHPALKVVLEHVSTRHGVDFINESPSNIVGTITAHHLLYNRNDLLRDGLSPHLYCVPVLKTEDDRLALLAAATSGSPRFFLGSDSAPHVVSMKESSKVAAGVFSGYALISLYLEAFESVGALDKFEGFAAIHGASFYGVGCNQATVTYRRKRRLIPSILPVDEQAITGDGVVDRNNAIVPLKSGQYTAWTRME